MTVSPAHRKLAEKYLYKNAWKEVIVPDSLLNLVAYVFSEEEAHIICQLGIIPLPGRIIARKAKRPIYEVEPILKSLARRVLIFSFRIKEIELFAFMPLAPGLFEAQMIRSQGEKHLEYFRGFAQRFEEFYQEFFSWLKPRIEKKDLQFGRIIPLEQAITSNSQPGILTYDTDYYSEIIERNNSFCIVNVCACRQEKQLLGKGCGKPLDVCSAMGWLADMVIEKGLGRRVSRQEFIEVKSRAAQAGLVNMVDNLHDPLQVCSCCGCCCGVLRVLNQFNIPTLIARSHFEAVVDPQKCQGCQTCTKWCPVNAITLNQGKAVINYTRCIGCGICVTRCEKNQALKMKERKNYRPPAENAVEYVLNRFFEIKGFSHPLLPHLSLGVGKLLEKLSPFHLSGPRYHPSQK